MSESIDYYYLSNDKINVNKLQPTKACTFIGVANPDSLHVLGALLMRGERPDFCVFYDANVKQLEHLRKMIGLLSLSRDRIDFAERLLAVKFGNVARKLLLGFQPEDQMAVPGAEPGVGSAAFEKRVWSDTSFDSEEFGELAGAVARKEPDGIHITASVIGGMPTQILTLLCVSSEAYNSTPFSLRFGYGYLAGEVEFQRIKRFLQSATIEYRQLDVADSLDQLLLEHRYERIRLWVSNIFTSHFVGAHPSLERVAQAIVSLGSSVRDLPQIDISVISDRRARGLLDSLSGWGCVRKRLATPHYKSFFVTRQHTGNRRTLEVVNVARWIAQDRGRSKLPCGDYCLLDQFLLGATVEAYEVIFLHMLYAHGASKSQLLSALRKAREECSTVLVLEHNSSSTEFLLDSSVSKIHDASAFLPRPAFKRSIPGDISSCRNYLYVYENKPPLRIE